MKIFKMGKFLKFVTNDAVATTIAPFGIYISEENITDVVTINHESIHWKQQLEMLILPFYIWYFLEWLIRLIVNGRNAYYAISFEHESYTNENNLKYLETRKHYSWLKYMKYKS
jgi:hypothetical protein